MRNLIGNACKFSEADRHNRGFNDKTPGKRTCGRRSPIQVLASKKTIMKEFLKPSAKSTDLALEAMKVQA